MDWITKPTSLLWLDAFGALTTAFATGLLLATEILATGLPTSYLWFMSMTAAGFAVFDLLSYRFAADARRPLAIVAVLNLLYCTVAVTACSIYWSSLTTMGLIYFGLESALVVPLAILELVVASRKE